MLLKVLSNGAWNLPPIQLSPNWLAKLDMLGVVYFMPHLIGFLKTCVLDLLAMLFHPVKVPSLGFGFLLDSYSVYCVLEVLMGTFSSFFHKAFLFTAG